MRLVWLFTTFTDHFADSFLLFTQENQIVFRTTSLSKPFVGEKVKFQGYGLLRRSVCKLPFIKSHVVVSHFITKKRTKTEKNKTKQNNRTN